MTADVLARNELTAFDEMKPHASYIKTILGQVGVNVWDRFTQEPAYVILHGDPKRKADESIVDVWTPKEDSYFRRNNKRHFENGVLIPYTRPENVEVELPIEQYPDEQLQAIINLKFIALQHKLNEINSVPVLFRMKSLAEEMEKSNKITGAIEKRISDVQMAQFTEKPATEKVEE